MTHPLALGIDIGGTNTAFGIVTREGNIVAKGNISTTGHASLHDYIGALAANIKTLVTEYGESVMMQGIGIGAPNGNYFTGEIAFAPNLPWSGRIALNDLLSEATGLPCTLTNDANAAAIGEMIYGGAKDIKDFVVVTLGTGVGSGFVANGQVIYGHDGFAGELGHIIAVRDGRKCGCGRNGCLEAYCSATGIVRTVNEWLQERTDLTLLRTYAGNITASLINDAALKGDALAMEAFEFTGKILGQTLADIVAITSPKVIFFFGGLAKAGDILLNPTQKYMEQNMLNIFSNKVRLRVSALPDADAAILGASALVWQ